MIINNIKVTLDNKTLPSTIFEITNASLQPKTKKTSFLIRNVSNITIATLINSKYFNPDTDGYIFSLDNVESSIPLFRILNNDDKTPVDLTSFFLGNSAPPLFDIFNSSSVSLRSLNFKNFDKDYTQPSDYHLFNVRQCGQVKIDGVTSNKFFKNFRKHI